MLCRLLETSQGTLSGLELNKDCAFLSPGCLNGGGQIRPGEGETSKELINRLDELYNSLRLYHNSILALLQLVENLCRIEMLIACWFIRFWL